MPLAVSNEAYPVRAQCVPAREFIDMSGLDGSAVVNTKYFKSVL